MNAEEVTNGSVKIPVELYGGPLDGHQTEVMVQDLDSQVFLFKHGVDVHGYAWGGRTLDGGKLWVLNHLQKVGSQGGMA